MKFVKSLFGIGPCFAVPRRMRQRKGEGGFSMIELLTVVAVMGIIAIFALPSVFRTSEDLRLRNDGRAIAQMVGVVKMRAASKFSRARLFVTLDDNTYFTQFWDRTANTWVTEGGP